MSTSTLTLTPTATARPVRRAGTAPQAPRPAVRLTRRGRVVVFALGLLLALAAGFALAAGSTATERSEPTTTVQVGAGETLWDIARGVAPAGRTADMVEHIKDLNGLTGGALQAGQELRVPAAR